MAMLWGTPGSWLSSVIVKGWLAGTARQVVVNAEFLAVTRSAVPVPVGVQAVPPAGVEAELAGTAAGAGVDRVPVAWGPSTGRVPAENGSPSWGDSPVGAGAAGSTLSRPTAPRPV